MLLGNVRELHAIRCLPGARTFGTSASGVLLLFIASIAQHSCSAVEATPLARVAVAPFQLLTTDGKAAAQSDGVTRGLEDAMLATFAENPRLQIMERADLEKAFREQKLSASGLIESDGAAKAGMILKADFVVVGRVRAVSSEFNAVVRVISCATGHVLGASELQGTPATIGRQASSAAEEISSAIEKFKGLPSDTAKPLPLEALKHHERAVALKAANAFVEAAGEELRALSADASLPGAEESFLDALAKAGFPDLAKAEALRLTSGDALKAKNTVLGALAALPDPPPSPPAPVVEPLNIDAVKRLAEWFDRRGKEGDALARRDACSVWMGLGDRYAHQGRDGQARWAYTEGLRRVRQLRSSDPLVAADGAFEFSHCMLLPAEHLLEMIFANRKVWRPTVFDSGEQNRWEAVLRSPKLPEGAAQSLPVHVLDVPIVDQVYLPAESNRGEYRYCFQIDWKSLPADTQVVHAEIVDRADAFKIIKSVRLVQQRWVGSEANSIYARKGVAWRDTVGRSGSPLLSLAEVLTASLALKIPPFGLSTIEPDKASGPCSQVRIWAIFPQGKIPAGAEPDMYTRAEAGLLAYLKGDKRSAAAEWTSARTISAKHKIFMWDKVFWERLIASCGGAKP